MSVPLVLLRPVPAVAGGVRGTAWLWWHSYRVYGDAVNGVAAGQLVTFFSRRDGLHLMMSRGWPLPDPPDPLFRSYPTEEDIHTNDVPVLNVVSGWERRRLCFRHSRYSYLIDPRPPRRGSGGPPGDLRDVATGVIATGTTFAAPHAVVAAATAVPPLLWLSLRSRLALLLADAAVSACAAGAATTRPVTRVERAASAGEPTDHAMRPAAWPGVRAGRTSWSSRCRTPSSSRR